ncbi:MAG: hypothetical protein M1829_002421 [Trizodia sp. TS-e1964]|nr:MAG: hypothetical protein M1829_002421 [Trizodia sp. TS-e1964]
MPAADAATDAVAAAPARRLASTPTPTVTTNASGRSHHSYARGVLDYFRGPRKSGKADAALSDADTTVMAVDLAVSTTPSPNTHPLHTKPRARDEYLRGLVAHRESTFGLPLPQLSSISHARNMAYRMLADPAASDALLPHFSSSPNPTRPAEFYQKNLRDRERAALDTASEKKYVQEWGFYLKCYAEGRYNLSLPPTPPPKRKEFTYLLPPLPVNELDRLTTVSYMTVPIPEWAASRARDLVGHAMFIFKVPYASISYFDKDKEVFKAEFGYLRASIPRHVSLGAHSLLSLDPMVIMDTHQDWRFAKNPLVLERPYIRFYASAPLIAKNGCIIGVFAIFSPSPTRSFLDMHRQSLNNFAKRAMTDAELLVEDFKSLDTEYKTLDDPGRVLEERFSMEGVKPASTPTSPPSVVEPPSLPSQAAQIRMPTAKGRDQARRNGRQENAMPEVGKPPNERGKGPSNLSENNSPSTDVRHPGEIGEVGPIVSQQAKRRPSSPSRDSLAEGKEGESLVPYHEDRRGPPLENRLYPAELKQASAALFDNKSAFLPFEQAVQLSEYNDEPFNLSDTDSFAEYAAKQSRVSNPSKEYDKTESSDYTFSLLRRMQEEEDLHGKYGENSKLLLNEVPEALNIMKRRIEPAGQRKASSASSSETSFLASTRRREPFSFGIKSIHSESSGLTESSNTTWSGSSNNSVQLPASSKRSDPPSTRQVSAQAAATNDTSDAAIFKRNFFDKHWGPASDVHPSAQRPQDTHSKGLEPQNTALTARSLFIGPDLSQIFPSPPSSPASLPPKRKAERIELALSMIASELDFDIVFVLRMVASASKIPTATHSSLGKNYTAQLLFSHGMPLSVPFVCNPEVHLSHILRGNSVRFGVPTLAERRGVSSDYELGILLLLSLPLSPENLGNPEDTNSSPKSSGGARPPRIPQFGRIHIFGAFRKTAPPGARINDAEESILQDKINSLRHIFFSTHTREPLSS